MTDATRSRIVDAFENFSKWETYSTVFALMTQRKATLREIQEIAADPRHDLEFGRGISLAVIAMRRRDILGTADTGRLGDDDPLVLFTDSQL